MPEETKGLTRGRRFGSRLEWLGPTACRSTTAISGLSHGASVEAVSYGAAPAAWLPPQPSYAPGASETVSVVPLSCSWTYSRSSIPTEHVLARGALSNWLSPTPYREKRSSASGRVCSFRSWPEGPTGWGARAPNPCVRITDPETEPVWASCRGSWECASPVLSREQGLPPLLSWRHGAIGTARRAGPCTYMHVLRTQTAGLTCGAERLTYGSTGHSGRQLQTDLGDGCIRRCTSAWASWKEVYERPSSRCADPRLVVTHRFFWAQRCKGWKTLPSYRLEGPVSSRPSPVGQWFPHKTWASAAFTALRRMPMNLEDAGWTESHSQCQMVHKSQRDGWAAPRHPDTVQAGPAGPPT